VDDLHLIAVELPLVVLPKKQRTRLHTGICDDCQVPFFARSLNAVVAAADAHIVWHHAVNNALKAIGG